MRGRKIVFTKDDNGRIVKQTLPPPQEPPKTTSVPLSNVQEQLRATTRRTLGMGWCNQDTRYYKSMLEHLPGMLPESFAFMAQPLVHMGMVRTALRYRTGTLYNNKLAHRFGYAKDASCPAGCGHAYDSIEHALSGCPRMEAMRTERHNRAGAIIAHALYHNPIGAYIHSMDVGEEASLSIPRQRLEAQRGHGRPAKMPVTIGSTLFTPGYTGRLADQRPDIVLVQRHADNTNTVHLVEIKYARDTWTEKQVLKAKAQYGDLAAELRKKKGQKVRIHTAVLGVGGAIFHDTQSLLEQFEIPPRERAKVLRALHVHSIRFLHATVKKRRQLEIQTARLNLKKTRATPPTDTPEGEHDMAPPDDEEEAITATKRKRTAGGAQARRRTRRRRAAQRRARNPKRGRSEEGSKESGDDDRGDGKGDGDDDGMSDGDGDARTGRRHEDHAAGGRDWRRRRRRGV